LLDADRCVATLAAQACRYGAIVHQSEPVREIQPTPSGVAVRTEQGTYTAARLILSAGSWLRTLLRQLDLDLPLTITKEQVAFFQPRDPAAFMPGPFPLFIHRFPGTTSLGSGFPIFGHTGVKMMLDRIGPEIDPVSPDHTVDQPNLDRLRAYTAAILPALGDDMVQAVTCRYTMTPDEDFIIDRHPAHPQIVIASPCSGHGFKFGVVIGRILADLAGPGATEYPIERFRLDRPALSMLAF
jgi:sarcosine oxidase